MRMVVGDGHEAVVLEVIGEAERRQKEPLDRVGAEREKVAHAVGTRVLERCAQRVQRGTDREKRHGPQREVGPPVSICDPEQHEKHRLHRK